MRKLRPEDLNHCPIIPKIMGNRIWTISMYFDSQSIDFSNKLYKSGNWLRNAERAKDKHSWVLPGRGVGVHCRFHCSPKAEQIIIQLKIMSGAGMTNQQRMPLCSEPKWDWGKDLPKLKNMQSKHPYPLVWIIITFHDIKPLQTLTERRKTLTL